LEDRRSRARSPRTSSRGRRTSSPSRRTRERARSGRSRSRKFQIPALTGDLRAAGGGNFKNPASSAHSLSARRFRPQAASSGYSMVPVLGPPGAACRTSVWILSICSPTCSRLFTGCSHSFLKYLHKAMNVYGLYDSSQKPTK
jgi:hypothetical protein